ncbi:DUF1684 domain-containing protein [Lapillicoccus sp.]|uniref:DUF1684 domain-containing protein n=1 Tax=Lapillicoccus sp. TaxID=1909287 RepID=UPI003262F74B
MTLLSDRVRLDFDYADNPSCAYGSRWACPSAPVENWLEVPIEAGKQVYAAAHQRERWPTRRRHAEAGSRHADRS